MRGVVGGGIREDSPYPDFAPEKVRNAYPTWLASVILVVKVDHT